MKETLFPRKYQQKSGSRQGEITAWMLSVLLILATFYLSNRSGLNFWFLVIDFLVILSAVLISFGNYVSRKSTIELSETGIEFFNGLRKIEMKWDQVKEIIEVPSKLGPKIWIISDNERIAFQTDSVIKWKEEVHDRIGFEDSDEIMEIIMDRLPHLEINNEGYYYPEE